jgi:hypothetical protein
MMGKQVESVAGIDNAASNESFELGCCMTEQIKMSSVTSQVLDASVEPVSRALATVVGICAVLP